MPGENVNEMPMTDACDDDDNDDDDDDDHYIIESNKCVATAESKDSRKAVSWCDVVKGR